jgi:Ca2+-binding RTX toxin-like protein
LEENVITGSFGDDRIRGGTNGSEIIIGLSGSDTINGAGGGTPYDDLLISNMTIRNNMTDQMAITETTVVNGSSRDTSEFIYGDYGNDEIHGSNRSDHLSGGPGSDVIYGNDGGDYIEGGPGIDSLYGGAGNDVFSGGEGADYFDCGPGRDNIDDFDPSEGDYALNNCEVIENEEKIGQIEGYASTPSAKARFFRNQHNDVAYFS